MHKLADHELRTVLGSAARDDIAARFDAQMLASCVMPALCASSHVALEPRPVHLTDALARVVDANVAISRAHTLAQLREQARKHDVQSEVRRDASFTTQLRAKSQMADVVWPAMALKLLAFNIDATQPGMLSVQCLWRATRKITADYIFFLHFLDEEVCANALLRACTEHCRAIFSRSLTQRPATWPAPPCPRRNGGPECRS